MYKNHQIIINFRSDITSIYIFMKLILRTFILNINILITEKLFVRDIN